MFSIIRSSSCVSLLSVSLLFSIPLDAPAAVIDFANQIAPILQKNCLGCHSSAKSEGGLQLDSRADAMKGGYSSAVIQPGKSADSRLIHVVTGTAEDETVMPPEGARLSAADIGLLRAWIDAGANWPESVTIAPPSKTTAKRQSHWAFQHIRRIEPPTVKRTDWPRQPIDNFILHRLEAEGIAPAAAADRRTLIRRVTLDLIGLPPTPKEVDDFIQDSRPDAYERLVDRLLASPHYGERWARPWLDLCHYADSDGYLEDFLRPFAWRYRHWLVEALNRDLPFDQFTIEQLAGDLLPNATLDQRIATGFFRSTLSNRAGGADLEEYRVEQIVDRATILGVGWLGLTVGCARCHDHKFDPISQKEFYSLYAFFDAADELNIDAPMPDEVGPYQAKLPEYQRQRRELLEPLAKEIAELQARWEKKLLAAVAQPGKEPLWDRQWELLGLIWGSGLGEGQLEGCQIVLLDPSKRTSLQNDRLLDYFIKRGAIVDEKRFAELKLGELSGKLDKLQSELPKITRAPTLRQTQNPRTVYLHLRGDFRVPGIVVTAATPASVSPQLEGSVPLNRVDLANWLVSEENPLTSRVTVNRMWQEFFGVGLVLTSDNFGLQGEKPSHPELLDWLASEFMRQGWSMKAMSRLIVTSATYKQSSAYRPELVDRDPNNRLLARQSSLRLSDDQVRDSMLAASGLLNAKIGGPSVRPPQPDSVSMEGFENTWKASEGADRYRRGLYTFIQRTSPFAQKVIFDAPALSRSCTRRERSNTPLQALTLLNDPVFFEGAQALALRLLREKGLSDAGRIEQAFRLCLGRAPEKAEADRLLKLLEGQAELHRADPAAVAAMFPQKPDGIDVVDAANWTAVCSVLLNVSEFVTRD